MSNNFRAFEFGIRIAGGFATDPVTGKLGEIYINTSSNLPRFYNGTTWIDFIKNEFSDSLFRIFDDGDITKKIAFQASGISSSTTRTITMPDNDVNLGNMVSKAASSTDNAIARFDGVTGALIQNSGAILDDTNNLSGLASIIISDSSSNPGISITKTGTSGSPLKLFITNGSNTQNIIEVSTTGGGNHLATASSSIAFTENLRIGSGQQTGIGGGAGDSGSLILSSGNSSQGNTGSVNLSSGATGAGGLASGVVTIGSGNSISNFSGDIQIQTGTGLVSGNINLVTGADTGGSGTGGLNVTTGNSSGTGSASGGIIFTTGDSTNALSGNSGSFQVLIGTSTQGFGGDVSLSAGASTNGTGGSVLITGGSGPTNGQIIISSFGAASINAAGLLSVTSSLNAISITANSNINLNPGAVLFVNAPNGVRRSTDGATYVDEFYIDSITLLASQTNTIATALTFQFSTYEGMIIDYKIKEATTGNVRVGTLYVATDGITAQITDTSVETASVGVGWIAVISGADVQLQYTTTSNNKIMRADIKKVRA